MQTTVMKRQDRTGADRDTATRDARPDFLETEAFRRMTGSAARVVILAAPAGYGKSSLLGAVAAAAATQALSVAWRGPDTASAELSLADADLILMDDAHLADPGRFLQMVRATCVHEGAHRLFIATRTLPEADWFSLQASGLLDIFRPEELVMSRSETEAMLRHYAGAAPSPAQTDLIHAMIGGWPIAAQWYGMLARRRGGWSRLTIAPPHAHDDLGRYLNEMIHAELDGPLRDFLFDMADLERFTLDMLGAILPHHGLAMLQRLRRENLIVEEAGMLKLHGLLQAFLEGKRQESGRPRNIALLDRASRWAAAHGLHPESVEHSIRADRLDAAHDLLDRHCADIVNVRGDLPGMLRWTDQLRRAGLTLTPSLSLWRIWALILAGELGRAEQELTEARAGLDAAAPTALHRHADRLELSLAARRQAPEQIIALATRWIDRWGGGDPFHLAATCVLRALAHHAQGQVLAAQRDMATAQRAALECDGLYARLWVAKAEAYVGLRTGRVAAARDKLLSAIDLVRRDGPVAPSALGTLHLLASRIFVELRDFARAREHLAAGHLYMGDTGLVEIHLASSEAAVLIAELDGFDAARREIDLYRTGSLRAALERDIVRVRLSLRHGKVADAREAFDTALVQRDEGRWHHIGHAAPVPDSLVPGVRTVHAQLLFAEGAVRRAETVFEELLSLADTRGNMEEYLNLLFTAAACAHLEGRRSDARRLLGRALRVAGERSTLSTALMASWPVRAMLTDMDDLEESLRHDALALLAAIRAHHGLSTGGSDEAPVEALTPRESEVLHMLDTGLGTDAIADHLAMGPSTAKWHVRNIYSKLGARNRTGALARARRLGLIRDIAV